MRHPVRNTIPGAFVVLAATLAVPLSLLAGTPRLQMFFGSTFSDQAYSKKVYDKVAQSWTRPAEAPKEGAKAVVITAILRDGKAPQQTLHLSSGSRTWDDAALAAVKKAAPFDPLPKSYGDSSIEVHFHFEHAK